MAGLDESSVRAPNRVLSPAGARRAPPASPPGLILEVASRL